MIDQALKLYGALEVNVNFPLPYNVVNRGKAGPVTKLDPQCTITVDNWNQMNVTTVCLTCYYTAIKYPKSKEIKQEFQAFFSKVARKICAAILFYQATMITSYYDLTSGVSYPA